MRSLITSVLLGIGALGITASTPAYAQASWLSEFLHRRFDPAYGAYYYDPGYTYYAPAPVYSYEVVPSYVPYRSYYYAPRYDRDWDRHHGHEWHDHHHDSHHHHR